MFPTIALFPNRHQNKIKTIIIKKITYRFLWYACSCCSQSKITVEVFPIQCMSISIVIFSSFSLINLCFCVVSELNLVARLFLLLNFPCWLEIWNSYFIIPWFSKSLILWSGLGIFHLYPSNLTGFYGLLFAFGVEQNSSSIMLRKTNCDDHIKVRCTHHKLLF